jgi:small subunit ribosomal protein S25e|tara:strand:+ start:485 stop:988 length:504 start_codon:yes stop_codon:yes gene_type:complete
LKLVKQIDSVYFSKLSLALIINPEVYTFQCIDITYQQLIITIRINVNNCDIFTNIERLLGGQKKKTISKSEKKSNPEPIKMEKKNKSKFAKIQTIVTVPEMDEKEASKTFIPMKAITIYSTAKSLGINASIANKLIKKLEGKGILEKVGGYGGHYVYKYAGSRKKTL